MRTHEIEERMSAAAARAKECYGKDNDAFDAATAEIEAMKPDLIRARKRDEMDRLDVGTPLSGDQDVAREIRSQSITETLRYAIGAPCDRAKVEREQRFLEERAGVKAKGVFLATETLENRATQTTANSAAIAPSDFRPDLFTSALMNSTIIQSLGATVLTGLSGDVIIPRETGSPAVAWVNEDQAVPTGNATFDSLTLTPHTVGAMTEVSRQLTMQSSPAIDGIIRQSLTRNIGLAIDAAALAGTGVGPIPRGVLFDPDIVSLPSTGDLFDDTADMIAAADLANVAASRAFVTTRSIKGAVMKMRDLEGRAIPISEIFHGERVEFTNQMPGDLGAGDDESGMVYGDWRDFLVGIWSQIDILANPFAESAYAKGNILLRAMATVDFGVRRPDSFVKMTGLTVGDAS